MKFVKMHGCGNDYVYLDAVTDPAIAGRIDEPGWPALVKRMSDRHKGIGSDGVIVLCPPTTAAGHSGSQVRMRMFNADGSESEMCGNGIRCVAKFAHDRLGVRANPMFVQTGRGILSIAYRTEHGRLVEATVDMGEPILDLANIPVSEKEVVKAKIGAGYSIRGFDGVEDWCFVSMGNPHAVSFELGGLLDLNREIRMLDKIGRSLEHHAAFPNRANIHIAKSANPGEATVFTWERGAGITQACGTGTCAVLVAGVLAGRLNREADIHVLGGTLRIRWDDKTNHVFMTGEAVDVFEGTWIESPPPSAPAKSTTTLRTPRLVLRPFALDDASEVARLAGDRRIAATTLRLPHPYEPHHAVSWIASHDAQRAGGTGAVFAVCENTGSGLGALVGAIGLEIDRTHNRAELGYWIGVPYWNRGYATEASLALLRHGFEDLNLNRIFAGHYAANPASGRVLEKIGMKREGLLPHHITRFGVVHDLVQFGIVREDWSPANSPAPSKG